MGLRPSLEELRNLGHHATVYQWGIQFIGLPSLIKGFTSADLNTRAISTSTPNRSIQEIAIPLRGHTAYQHGIMKYNGTFKIDLYETVDSKVANFLESYMNLQWTPITGTQIPKLLNQCAFLLTLLDSYDKPRKYYTIIGAWLKGFNEISLGADQSEVIKYSTEWQYDYYI